MSVQLMQQISLCYAFNLISYRINYLKSRDYLVSNKMATVLNSLFCKLAGSTIDHYKAAYDYTHIFILQ